MMNQHTIESVKSSLTEADGCVQEAQKVGEALLSGIQALIQSKEGTHTANLRNAAVLCERLDTILFTLMNDVNCIAERHGAHHDETFTKVQVAHVE